MTSFLNLIRPVWQPHEGQRDFLLSNARLKVLACGRRWGKTDVCAAQVVSTLFGDKPTKHFIIAPTLEQAKILFNRVIDLIDKLITQALVDWDKPNPKVSPFP